MVRFVNDEMEITTLEARRKYRGFYIGFVDSKPIDPKENPDMMLGKVLYTADAYDEQDDIPAQTEDGKQISVLYGMGLKDLPMGGVIMERIDYKQLNLKKLQKKKSIVVPTEKALMDVEPIKWSEDVINGRKQVLLVKKDQLQESELHKSRAVILF
jgi:hypothetical protein